MKSLKTLLLITACLLLVTTAQAENGPTPQVLVGSNGISDSSVTTAKIADDAVTAEKLDETEDYAVNDMSMTGFTKLGDAATPVKMKVLSIADIGSTPGARVSVAHSLANEKIISFTCLVGSSTTDVWMNPEWPVAAGYKYSAFVNDTFISLDLTDAASLFNNEAKITIWYVE